jgi:hypothetical protein
MNIANAPGVQSAVSAAQAPAADGQQILVLKKALDMQSSSAATLIESLPQAPELADSGTLGRNVNTFA